MGASNVVVVFLRYYIVIGFIVAVLLNVYIIRLLARIQDFLEANRAIFTQMKEQSCQPSQHQVEVNVHQFTSKPDDPTVLTHGGSVPGESSATGDGS